MPRRRDGRAAQAGAASSVDQVAITRQSKRSKEIDQHDARALARLRADHYTRVPLLGEQTDSETQCGLIFRGPDGSFTRFFFERPLTAAEVVELLPGIRDHNATFSAICTPRRERGQA